ncbi:FMN-binding negative transcriptional regulator [Altibacter sp. HG106]|uniref:FMN-binding negative transcriptional regulator n=1 Tax=Altibacter sp. HG106 TaxID=3023937 RepID=UPI00234FFD55|nr:FMN-binding negative transcriptional regulator [Altibacter sp. HG106]MDC7995971.1 FMN-binding negative transcriptional regulator [Altibacter sp. HG106]
MYPPPHHQSERLEHMRAVARACPLAVLLTAKENVPYATHLPVMLAQEEKRLIAHIDRQNPQCDTIIRGAAATVIFKGPDTYISPSVYDTSQLPTWNYIIVHVSGVLTPIDDPDLVKTSMVEMTAFLEGNDPKFQLSIDDVRMERLLPYIQTFEITDLQWEGKFKLSQDKSITDMQRAKEALLKETKASWHELIHRVYTEFM